MPLAQGYAVAVGSERAPLGPQLLSAPGAADLGRHAACSQRSRSAGFVYDSKGHIVTNYHVIRGASDVLVSCCCSC